jgi:hypothetical protein
MNLSFFFLNSFNRWHSNGEAPKQPFSNIVFKLEVTMTEYPAESISNLVSQDSLELDSQKRLLEAELYHRTHQIRHFNQLDQANLTAGSKSRAAIYKRLIAARAKTADNLRNVKSPSPEHSSGIPNILLDFTPSELVAPRLSTIGETGFLFGTEGVVALPRAMDGTSIAPTNPSAHGKIITSQLGPRCEVFFRADGPTDNEFPLGVFPPTETEQIWLHNWKYVVPFPCVPTASYFTYQFTVNIVAQLFTGGPPKGMLMSFVSIGEVPSATPTGSIEVNKDAGWPLIMDFEEPIPYYNGHYGQIPVSLQVERTFAVGANQTPAVAIVVGFVIRLTTGGLRLSFFGDSAIGFVDCAVRYRYTPIPVLAPA